MAKVPIETCFNCDKQIGRMEQAYVHKGNVVCEDCYKRFNNNHSQTANTPTPTIVINNQRDSSNKLKRSKESEEILHSLNPKMARNNLPFFILSIILIPVYGIGLAILVLWWLKCKYTKLIVTTRKTILQTGILSKKINEVFHRDVRNIITSQTFSQRLFNTGKIEISSSGQANIEITCSGIYTPERIKQTINNLRD